MLIYSTAESFLMTKSFKETHFKRCRIAQICNEFANLLPQFITIYCSTSDILPGIAASIVVILLALLIAFCIRRNRNNSVQKQLCDR